MNKKKQLDWLDKKSVQADMVKADLIINMTGLKGALKCGSTERHCPPLSFFSVTMSFTYH